MTTYIMKTHQIMGLSRIWAHLQLQHLHFLPPLNQSNKVIPTQQRLEKNLCKNVVFISTHRNFAGHHQMKFCNSRYYVTFHLRSKSNFHSIFKLDIPPIHNIANISSFVYSTMAPEQEHKLWNQHGFPGGASPSTTRSTEHT